MPPLAERFDHAVIAVSDLDAAVERYRQLGFEVMPGGRHEGVGTQNALVRFGLDYLELLSVYDEAAARAAGSERTALVEFIRRGGGLAGFALASSDLDALADRLRSTGLPVLGPYPRKRMRPDGRILEWRLLSPGGVSCRRPWPFFIQWGLDDASRLQLEAQGTHANGALGVAGITVAVKDLGEAVHLYQQQIGIPLRSLGPRSATGSIGATFIKLRAPGSTESSIGVDGEGPVEIVLRSRDLDAVRRHVTSQHLAERYEDLDGRSVVVIPAEAACGARLIFV